MKKGNIMVCPKISVTNKADHIKQKGDLGTDRQKILNYILKRVGG
jgi:hypothetical protein